MVSLGRGDEITKTPCRIMAGRFVRLAVMSVYLSIR
jgi:hypothetical protein